MNIKMTVLAIVFMACTCQRVACAGAEGQLTQAPMCAGVDKASCEEKSSVQNDDQAFLLQVKIGAQSQANANMGLPMSSLQQPQRMRAGGFIEEWVHQKALAQDSGLAEHDEIDLAFLSFTIKIVREFDAVRAIAAYVGCLTLGGLVITLIYWSLGACAISKILLYLGCGCTITISVKAVYHDDFHFRFPKLLTTFHLLATAAVGFAMLLHRKLFQGSFIRIPSFSEFAFNLVPLCLGTTYSLGCSNSALMFCSVAFAEMIGASTPFFSILLIICLGMSFNWYLLWPLSGIVFGCMGTVIGTVDFSAHGLLLLLLANLGRACKAVFQQWLMTGKVTNQYDPVTLLAWESLICSPLMLTWSALTEGAPAYAALFQQARPELFWGAVAMSCAIAAALNTSGMFVVKEFGAVGIQATAQLKQSVVVLGGVVLFGEVVTPVNILSGATVMLSSFWYSQMASKSKGEQALESMGEQK